MPRVSTNEMEQPAKQWQIADMQKELQMVNNKLDTLIEAAKVYVSQEQLNKTLAEAKDYTDDKQRLVEERYGPIYKLFWAAITAIVVQAGLIAFLFTK